MRFSSICRRDSTCRCDTRGNLCEWLRGFVCRRRFRTRIRRVRECVDRDVDERIQRLLCHRDHRICRNRLTKLDFLCRTDLNVVKQLHMYPLETKFRWFFCFFNFNVTYPCIFDHLQKEQIDGRLKRKIREQ